MRYVVGAGVGILVGSAVEHLGSLSFGPWGWAASQLSAPWLLLPFALGTLETRPARAALIGLVGTMFAVFGYVTLLVAAAAVSAHGLSVAVAVREAGSQARWFVAGAVSGPVYGVLGERWRRLRWWPGAVLAAGALALEPAVLLAVGRTFGPPGVYASETAAGCALAACLYLAGRRWCRGDGGRTHAVRSVVPPGAPHP